MRDDEYKVYVYVTNTELETGAMEVTKRVEGDGADPDDTFEFEVVDGSGNALTFSETGVDGEYELSESGVLSRLSISDGQTVRLAGFPFKDSIKVKEIRESMPSGYDADWDDQDESTYTVSPGSTTSVELVNVHTPIATDAATLPMTGGDGRSPADAVAMSALMAALVIVTRSVCLRMRISGVRSDVADSL